MSLTLQGEVQTFCLTGNDKDSRKYINCNINYLALKNYCKIDTYDVDTGTGEQREQSERHIKKLREAILNRTYTPASFSASVTDKSTITFQNNGKVKIVASENSKLSLLNGGHRKNALDSIARDNVELKRVVENLPIPIIIYLDGETKDDFVRLNQNLMVNKGQLLNMRIDTGNFDPKKLVLFKKGRELIKLAHSDEGSPFYRMVKFTSVGSAPLNFTQLLSDRKSDMLGSFLLSAKLVDFHKEDAVWFQSSLNEFYKFVKTKTICANEGYLLCPPPSGAKGCANLIISTFNQFLYYLYLHARSNPIKKDWDILKKGLVVYEQEVGGDLSGKRRANLANLFAQTIYKSIVEDDDSTVACHHGIPIGLLVLTSPGNFNVESPGKLLLTQDEEADDLIEPIKLTTEPIYQVHIDSDTSEGFIDG